MWFFLLLDYILRWGPQKYCNWAKVYQYIIG